MSGRRSSANAYVIEPAGGIYCFEAASECQMDLKGKAIVITGAAQGLGQKMAETVAARGANVALVDVDYPKMKDTVRLCSRVGSEVKDYAADVTDEQAVVALFDSLHKDFGRVDGVINNAGITSDGLLVKVQDGKVQNKMSLEDFHKVIAVDLRGSFCADARPPRT